MLRKHASMEVLDAWRVPGSNTPRSLRKAAHRVEFEYAPRPGYLYVRSRAISSRTNDNHDTFPAAEIEKAYKTFLGKPAFVNHHNANHRRARGVIIAAAEGPHTLQKIGQIYGLTRMRICQIEKSIFEKIRTMA